MSKYLDRMFYTTPGERINPMMHVMLFFTLAFGIGFTFFGWADTVQASLLYHITNVNMGAWGTSLWGIACLVTVALASINIVLRVKVCGFAAGWMGVLVWFYAIFAYLLSGYIFQMVVTLPQLFMWLWHQERVRRYWNNDLDDTW